MSVFDAIRRKARELHTRGVEAGADADQVAALSERCADILDIELIEVSPGHEVLRGAHALFDVQSRAIIFESTDDAARRAQLIAHEIGHSVLHATGAVCAEADVDVTCAQEMPGIGLARVDDYGARERRELEANVFARELLLPRERCARLYLEESASSAEIAARTRLPPSLVRQQLLDALLLPAVVREAPAPMGPRQEDPSQLRAARHAGTPFLLQAGPGTGKTRTLVKRVLHLLEEGVEPTSVTVLTFSNRAAGELLERLTSSAPELAPQLWIGTFHAFGLDLVRRHYDRLGLPANPVLFDRSDAIEVLEELLPTLPLRHYRNLWDPAMILKEIVSAISRAKDEVADPATYRWLAQSMADSAGADGDRLKSAEQCLEIADVYDLYEAAMRRRGAVDFGDLIMRPALLLEQDADVRAVVQRRHRHVLVDEYQDVNRACGRLLKALCGDGERLWVVGDARQSIYRFRGASTGNLSGFSADYPGARVDALEVNYRSCQEVVDAFCQVASQMSASIGMLPLQLQARRGSAGRHPQLLQYETLDDEAGAIATSVRELAESGVAFREQAVLCRSNRRLNEIAEVLTASGIPVLHLGSFFERDDVRDILSLLSILVDPFGDALARVASKPRYAVPLQDVYRVSAFVRSESRADAHWLAQLSSISELSAAGRPGLERLAADLEGFAQGDLPWDVATEYLLDRTREIDRVARASTAAGRTSAIALWQLLNFLRQQPVSVHNAPIVQALARIRQLVLLAEERDLRQVPASALALDAVRLMTIHGSKGLEFEAVHVPGLTVMSLPSSRQADRCPPPEGLISEAATSGVAEHAKLAHAQEEECLFFVALSRARTHLKLYQARKTRELDNRSPSPFVAWLPETLLARLTTPPAPVRHGTAKPAIPFVPAPGWAVTDSRLVAYEKCPRRFFYTHVLGLGGARKQTAFSRTHDCVHRVVRWVRDTRPHGSPSTEEAMQALDRIWVEKGPGDHAYADDYRRLATMLTSTLIDASLDREFHAPDPIPVAFANGQVVVEPDEVYRRPDGRMAVRRVRTGHKRSNEGDQLEYALYLLAAQAAYGGQSVVEALHLADGESGTIELTPRKLKGRKEKSESYLAGIKAGQFPEKIDSVACPRCPHFFICPAVPAGELVTG